MRGRNFSVIFLILAMAFLTACNNTESEPIDAPIIPPPVGYVGFPSLHLTSNYDPFAVERDFWHEGNATLWGADEDYNFNDEVVQIRGRGSSTWAEGAEKRPLRLRFTEARHMLGSCYAHRDWVLLANLFDPGLVRNHAAFYLASLLEAMDFTPLSKFVHLYINGEYVGLYQLTDERNPEPGRSPLHFDPDPAMSEYMFERNGDIRFPRRRDHIGHQEYLRDYISYVDEIIRSGDFDAIQQVIDIPSMIDFLLVQKFMNEDNMPVFNGLMTLRGQGEERRIFFGPVWGFDRSAGNSHHEVTNENWLSHLLYVPEIFELAAKQWNEIKDVQIRQTIENIAYIAEAYKNSFLRNFELHDHILDSDPSWELMLPQETREIDTFQGQIEYLLAWFEERVYTLTIFFEQQKISEEAITPTEMDNFFTVTIPSLHLTTDYNPFRVERTFWHDGTIAVSGAALSIHNFDPVDASFRGRGNSTWAQGGSKRPLRFRFHEAQPLFGSGYAATDWILLADHFDRSLFRNYAALYLGNLLSGLSFTPGIHHVHLYVNDEYMGVYLLTDERDVNPGRMPLVWDEDPAKSDFFIELDFRAYQSGVLDDTFINVNGLLYDIRYPNNRRRRTPEHIEYIREHLHTVSHAIRRQCFSKVLELIDLDSFVDFYIVHELFKEFDILSQTSVFMYIQGQGSERRLFMGPIWDFDLSAGNMRNQRLGEGPEYLYVAVFNYWYRYLMRRPEFFEAVVTRWNEIVDREIAHTLEHVRRIATARQAEYERNFERHPILGVPIDRVRAPQAILDIDSFMGQVEFLLDWLYDRVEWMDDFFNGRMPGHDPLWALVEYHRYQDPIYISLNGEVKDFGFTTINIQHRVMHPVQGIASLFGLDVIYDLDSGISVLQGDDILIVHRTGDLYMSVNWEKVYIDVPGPLIIGEYLYFPIRIINDLLGYETGWGGTTHREVRIMSPSVISRFFGEQETPE